MQLFLGGRTTDVRLGLHRRRDPYGYGRDKLFSAFNSVASLQRWERSSPPMRFDEKPLSCRGPSDGWQSQQG
jgi:hypothetical protein